MLFQRSAYPRGKIVGGSGQMNFMLYARGNRHDFDRYLGMKELII